MWFVLAFALAAPADWIPVRWPSPDLASLDLVRGTRANCLLLEKGYWSAEFSQKANEAGIATLGVVREAAALSDLPHSAAAAKLNGIVIEGLFDEALVAKTRAALADSGLTVVELAPRTRMRFDSGQPIIGTFQGVWPGINTTEEDEAKAAPSGAPWIDTNSGFLRFARASTRSVIWMGNQPPPKTVIPVARYLQAIGDAAMVGARWIVSLDADFASRLVAREQKAVDGWKQIAEVLGFYAAHPEWTRWDAWGNLAIVQDTSSGGLISGGILDMISVKHTPVRPVPFAALNENRMKGATMAVSVDPAALSEGQKEILRRFTRGGGTLLSAPPGWKFPPQRDDQITLEKNEIEIIDSMWKEINSMTGRRNLGARMFNVASTLSNMAASPDGRRLVLQLVNFSDYELEDITIHLLGTYKSIQLYVPGAPPRPLKPFEADEGTGVEIAKLGPVAALVIE
jgi:hypothetical protein